MIYRSSSIFLLFIFIIIASVNVSGDSYETTNKGTWGISASVISPDDYYDVDSRGTWGIEANVIDAPLPITYKIDRSGVWGIYLNVLPPPSYKIDRRGTWGITVYTDYYVWSNYSSVFWITHDQSISSSDKKEYPQNDPEPVDETIDDEISDVDKGDKQQTAIPQLYFIIGICSTVVFIVVIMTGNVPSIPSIKESIHIPKRPEVQNIQINRTTSNKNNKSIEIDNNDKDITTINIKR